MKAKVSFFFNNIITQQIHFSDKSLILTCDSHILIRITLEVESDWTNQSFQQTTEMAIQRIRHFLRIYCPPGKKYANLAISFPKGIINKTNNG